jgi:hypothetical protein
MAGQGTYYGIGLDVNVEKGAQEAERSFKRIDSAADATSKKLDSLESGVRKLSGSVPALGSSFKSSGDRAAAAAEELTESIAIQKKVLADLESQLAYTRGEVNRTGGANKALVKQFRELIQEVNAEKAALRQLEEQMKSKSAPTALTFRTQMLKLSEQMRRMRMDGQQNTDEYIRLEAEMKRLAIATREFTTSQRAMSSGMGGMVSGMTSGLQGLMGAYTLASGVAGQFASDQEKLVKIQTRMQSSMAMLMGLQQVANTLHSTSAFRITVVTKATRLWDAWNARTAAGLQRLGMSANVARTAAIGLHGALALLGGAAVIAAIAVVSRLREEAKKNAEAQKKYRAAVSQSYADQLAQFRAMQSEWKAAEGNLKRQNEIYREQKKNLDALGISAGNRNEYDRIMVEKSGDVVDALYMKAQATAALSVAEELYRTAIENRVKAEDRESTKPNLWQRFKTGLAMSGASQTGADIEEVRTAMSEFYAGKNAEKAAKKAEEAEEKARKYIERYVETMTEFREKMKGSGFFTPEQADDAEAYAEAVRSATDKIDDLRSQSEEAAAKGRTAAMKDREELMQSLDAWRAYYDAKAALAVAGYERERAAAVKSYRDSEKEIERQRTEWAKKGWDTSVLDRQLAAVKDLLEKTMSGIAEAESRELLGLMLSQTDKLVAVRKELAKGIVDAEKDAAASDAEDAYMSELESYGSYEQKRFAIHMKWLGKINAADGEQRELYRKMFARELEELDAVYSTAYRKIFANVSDLSKAGMEEALALARGRLSKLISEGADVADIDAMSNRVNELQRAIDEFSFTGWDAGVEAVTESIHGLIAARNRLKNAQTAEVKDRNEIAAATEAAARAAEDMRKSIRATAVNSLLSAVSKIGDSMREIAEISGDEGLAEAGEMIAGFADTFGGSIEALARGDMIGAAVSAVTGVIDATVDAFVSYRKANEQFKRNNEMFRQSLEIMAVQINERDYEGMFGDRAARKAVDAFGAARKAMTQFRVESNKLYAESFKSRDYSWWSNLWGRSDTYTAFRTQDIWGEDGLLDPAKAKAFLETWNDELTDKQKEQIENAIELREAYEEGLSVVEGYVGDLLGGLGDSITDTLWDAIVSGAEAGFDDFRDIGAEAAKGIAKSFIKEFVVGTYLEQYRDRLLGVFAIDDDSTRHRSLAGILNEIMQSIPTLIGTAKAAVDSVLPASGYSVADFAESSRSAVAKSGFAASQDSVDETNGLLTVQNSMLSEVRDDARESRSLLSLMLGSTNDILYHVIGIHGDTASISSLSVEIRACLKEMKADVGSMATKGVKAL